MKFSTKKFSAVITAVSGMLMSPAAAQQTQTQAQEQSINVNTDVTVAKAYNPLKFKSSLVSAADLNNNDMLQSQFVHVSVPDRMGIAACYAKPRQPNPDSNNMVEKFLLNAAPMFGDLYGIRKGSPTIASFITENGDMLVMSQDKTGAAGAEVIVDSVPYRAAPTDARRLSQCVQSWALNPRG